MCLDISWCVLVSPYVSPNFDVECSINVDVFLQCITGTTRDLPDIAKRSSEFDCLWDTPKKGKRKVFNKLSRSLGNIKAEKEEVILAQQSRWILYGPWRFPTTLSRGAKVAKTRTRFPRCSNHAERRSARCVGENHSQNWELDGESSGSKTLISRLGKRETKKTKIVPLLQFWGNWAWHVLLSTPQEVSR